MIGGDGAEWAKRAGGALGALGLAAGLWWVAAEYNFGWQIWLGVAVFVGITTGPAIFDVVDRVRRYESLQARSEELEGLLASSKSDATRLASELKEARAEGLGAGKSEVIGDMLSVDVQNVPDLIGSRWEPDDVWVLAARHLGGDLLPGTRFALVSQSGSRVGVTRVAQVDASTEQVILEPADDPDSAYWVSVREASVADPSVPHGVKLARMPHPFEAIRQVDVGGET